MLASRRWFATAPHFSTSILKPRIPPGTCPAWALLSCGSNFTTVESPPKVRWPRRWSEEDKAKLENLFNAGIPRKELYTHFPDRTIQGIRYQISRMFGSGVLSSKSLWTPEEDAILRSAKTSGQTWRQVKQQLPRRSVASLQGRWKTRGWPQLPKRARRLDPDKRLKIFRLRDHEHLTWTEVGQQLGIHPRTAQSAYSRTTVEENRGPREPQSPPWTRSEIAELLRLKHVGLSHAAIAARLKRTPGNVMYRLNILRDDPIYGPIPGQTVWTEYEDTKLLEILISQDSATKSDSQLAREVADQFPGRSYDRVRRRIGAMKPFFLQIDNEEKSDLSTTRHEQDVEP